MGLDWKGPLARQSVNQKASRGLPRASRGLPDMNMGEGELSCGPPMLLLPRVCDIWVDAQSTEIIISDVNEHHPKSASEHYPDGSISCNPEEIPWRPAGAINSGNSHPITGA